VFRQVTSRGEIRYDHVGFLIVNNAGIAGRPVMASKVLLGRQDQLVRLGLGLEAAAQDLPEQLEQTGPTGTGQTGAAATGPTGATGMELPDLRAEMVQLVRQVPQGSPEQLALAVGGRDR